MIEGDLIMKIDFPLGTGFYNNRKPAGAEKEIKPQTVGKTDVAEFSHRADAMPDKVLLDAKMAVQTGMNAGAGAARLEYLTQSIRNGDYYVPTDAIAAAILDLEI